LLGYFEAEMMTFNISNKFTPNSGHKFTNTFICSFLNNHQYKNNFLLKREFLKLTQYLSNNNDINNNRGCNNNRGYVQINLEENSEAF